MIADLFAGVGWDVALAQLGHHDVVGFEYDPWVCATRAAAGMLTIRADLSRAEPVPCVGLIASPPCPMFSAAGKGTGRELLTELAAAVADEFRGVRRMGTHRRRMASALRRTGPPGKITRTQWADEIGHAVHESALSVVPARWIHDSRPEWVAMEQVPAIRPLWGLYAHHLRAMGYSVWEGDMNAADYGVPQTRIRRILIASRVQTVTCPEPTHGRNPEPTLFGQLEPWVSMASALGWGMNGRPALTLMTGGGRPDPLMTGSEWSRRCYEQEQTEGRWVVNTRGDRGEHPAGGNEFSADGPSWALTEKARSWHVRGPGMKYDRRQANDSGPVRAIDCDTEPARGDGVLLDRRQNGAPVVDDTTPSPTMTASALAKGIWQLVPGVVDDTRNRRKYDPTDEPAPTLAFGHDAASWKWEAKRSDQDGDDRARLGTDVADARYGDRAGTAAIRLTTTEAAVLQSFPPNMPWQAPPCRSCRTTGRLDDDQPCPRCEGTGMARTTMFRQIGNAVPLGLARPILAQVLPDRSP